MATPTKPSFEESAQEVIAIIETRRSSWTYLSLMEWSDVSAILRERIWRKWHLYEPAKAKNLEHWVNTVITHALLNLRRDNLLRYARPCIGGGKTNGKSCAYNLGGDSCGFTKGGKQCAECPLYAEWQQTREAQLNLKSNVALEHHAQEVSNIQGDFNDIEAIKDQLDARMKEELTQWEWKVYTLLYVQHLTPTMASVKLEELVKTWKRAPREEEQFSYQAVLQKGRWFKELMHDVLRREGHIS